MSATPDPRRPTAALMLQGTGSNVGKSLLVAGLCRVFSRAGLRVRPFKPQNMSNNAAVTADGGEIGRAQALQARAAGVPLSVHMNPVLLKPETETGAQVVIQGRMTGSCRARDYAALKPTLLPRVLESFSRLEEEADLILVEGAGSPAEVNLRQGDIANMGFALAASAPVVLVGDIERGGVIASLVGTHLLLAPEERALIGGYVVNRFRGDPALFEDAHPIIKGRTGMASFGVVPWFEEAALLPGEDVLDLERSLPRRGEGRIKVIVPRLPRIANFDDLDPLRAEPEVALEIVSPGRPLPTGADLVILPGSKATIADLEALREEGWDTDLRRHIARGGHVLGLCGGFQMLGRTVADPAGIEGPPATVPGLGLLDVETVLGPEKRLTEALGREVRSGAAVRGYEMHIGTTRGRDPARPFLEIDGRAEGAVSADGRVVGSYLHGLLASDAFRSAFLRRLDPAHAGTVAFEATIERILDDLADHLERHLDVDALLALARSRSDRDENQEDKGGEG